MIRLAIDLGSSMTKIYRADTNNGIVLAEPSCVAIAGEEREVKAIGKIAKNLNLYNFNVNIFINCFQTHLMMSPSLTYAMGPP